MKRKLILAGLIIAAVSIATIHAHGQSAATAQNQSSAPGHDRYQSTWESLGNYTTPNWFRDAKFGIFIHWGV